MPRHAHPPASPESSDPPLIHTHDYANVEHRHYLDAWGSNDDDWDNHHYQTYGPGYRIEDQVEVPNLDLPP